MCVLLSNNQTINSYNYLQSILHIMLVMVTGVCIQIWTLRKQVLIFENYFCR